MKTSWDRFIWGNVEGGRCPNRLEPRARHGTVGGEQETQTFQVCGREAARTRFRSVAGGCFGCADGSFSTGGRGVSGGRAAAHYALIAGVLA